MKLIQDLAPLKPDCAAIMGKLAMVLPQVQLLKVINSPHASNEDLVDFVFQRLMRTGERFDIAYYLLLVDECMAGLQMAPQVGCPLSARKLRDLKHAIVEMTEVAWVRFSRIFESDQATGKAELLKEARMRWYISYVAPLRQGPSVEDFTSQPGRWLPNSKQPRPRRQ